MHKLEHIKDSSGRKRKISFQNHFSGFRSYVMCHTWSVLSLVPTACHVTAVYWRRLLTLLKPKYLLMASFWQSLFKTLSPSVLNCTFWGERVLSSVGIVNTSAVCGCIIFQSRQCPHRQCASADSCRLSAELGSFSSASSVVMTPEEAVFILK